MASIYMGMDTQKEYDQKVKSGEVGYRNAVGPDSYYITEYMNDLNEASAQKQMDFQREMSSTAHQREVADLLAAGLNPMMSLNNGASSPSGAGFSVESSGLQTMLQKKQLQNNIKLQNMSNKNALKINNKSLKVQEKLNRYSTDMSYAASIFGALQSAEAQRYYSNAMADASRFGSTMSYLASVYNADKMLEGSKFTSENSLKGTKYNAMANLLGNYFGYKGSRRNAQLGAFTSLIGTGMQGTLGLLSFLNPFMKGIG